MSPAHTATVSRVARMAMVALMILVGFAGLGAHRANAASAAIIPSGIDPLCLLNPAVCVAREAGEFAGDVLDGISEGIAELAGGVFQTIVSFFGRAAVSMLEVTTGWWLSNPSLLVGRAGVAETIASYFYGLSAAMVLAGFIWNGIQIMVQRRAEPAAELFRATLTYAFVAGTGIALVQGAARATDAWAADLIDNAFDLENLPEVFGSLLLTNPVLFLLFSLVLLIFGVIQAVLLVMREVSLILLTGMIIFAASGQYFRFSKSWMGNLLGMIIPILLWKPIAAMLVAISLSWISQATSVGDLIIGLALFAGSALAIKPLQRLFVVFTPGTGAGPGGSGGAVSALGTGALGVAMLRGSAGGGAAAGGAGAGASSGAAAAGAGGGAAAAGGGAAAGGAGAGAAGAAGGPAGLAAGAAVTAVAQTARSQGSGSENP